MACAIWSKTIFTSSSDINKLNTSDAGEKSVESASDT